MVAVGPNTSAWLVATHKSMRRKDGSNHGRPYDIWHGEPRRNVPTNPRATRGRGCAVSAMRAPALPSHLGHVLTDNRRSLVVNVQIRSCRPNAGRHSRFRLTRDGRHEQSLLHQRCPSPRPGEMLTLVHMWRRTPSASDTPPSTLALRGTPTVREA